MVFVSQIDEIYPKAKRQAYLKLKEPGYDLPVLPEECPYTVEQLLNPEYFPESNL
ncbi:MAG: DUF29 family protein [Cyanophyceae cyanobacterium]